MEQELNKIGGNLPEELVPLTDAMVGGARFLIG